MRKLFFAALGAAALIATASGGANAAPVTGMDVKSAVERDASQAEQVHWRRWRHCHRWGCHGGHRWGIYHGWRHHGWRHRHHRHHGWRHHRRWR
jgi:hypothetical protein